MVEQVRQMSPEEFAANVMAARSKAQSRYPERLAKVRPAGQVVERTNGAGQTVSFRRDSFGGVLERRAGESLTSFEYDQAGRVTRTVNADAELVFERDALGSTS